MEPNKDDLKTQFVTREGCYRLLNLSEYSRPNRGGYQSNQNSPQVRVSFVSLPQSPIQVSAAQQQKSLEKGKRKKKSPASRPESSQLQNSFTFQGSSPVNNNINGNTSSNGPIPSSNSLSSSATTATVTSSTNHLQQEHNCHNQSSAPSGDWICFNFGKELYTYSYRGVKKVSRKAKG